MIDIRRRYEATPERPISDQIINDICAKIAKQLLPTKADVRDRVPLYKLLRDLNQKEWSWLRPRNKKYIWTRIQNFITIKDTKTVVACGELIRLDEKTIELGAMGTHPDYQNQWLSNNIIEFAEWVAAKEGKDIILVTDNLWLMRNLWKRGYSDVTHKYHQRHKLSPTKKIYWRTIPTGQWSDPIISGWIVASVIREVMFREARK